MEGGDGFGGLTVRSFFDRSQSEAYLVEYTFPRRHGIAVLHVALHAFSSYKGIVPSPSISRNTLDSLSGRKNFPFSWRHPAGYGSLKGHGGLRFWSKVRFIDTCQQL